MEPTFTRDGYPTVETCERLEAWPIGQPNEALDFLACAWSEYGEVRHDGDRVTFVTGGWSGNEDLVGALSRNPAVWARLWVSSERGGKHTFEKVH